MVTHAAVGVPGLGFGVVAGLPAHLLTALAREVEHLGYGSFWINDGGRPEADGLAGLAVVAAAATSLDLGVGVVALDRRNPGDIAAAVARLGLPLDRLRLGVGSGAAQQPLGLVRAGVAELRAALPGARIVISALGPRMSRLAGEIADGVLFNWAIPARLAEMSLLVAEGEHGSPGRRIERWAYVRAAVGPDARQHVGQEAGRYAAVPAYGRALVAMGAALDTIGIAGDDLLSQLRPYRHVLDGVVVRALPAEWTLEAVVAIARSAAPGLPLG